MALRSNKNAISWPNGRPQPGTSRQIAPHELPTLLDHYPAATTLSLDCFDTLLWRDCHAPGDIFTELTGLNALQRHKCEMAARRAAKLSNRGEDIGIDVIYAAIMPNATAEQRQAAIEAELDAEARHCFAFAPTVALMQAAKARGMRIILVSDTYLNPHQLRQLIARAAGEDVAAMIERIFCSSSYARPKAHGLFMHVLQEMGVTPASVVHVGDNRVADMQAAVPFGVHAVHMLQFSEEIEQQLRLESVMDGMIHVLHTPALTAPQPHRAALAHATPQLTDPAQHFGYAVLGPLLTGFDRWLETQAQALQQKHGGTIHWLYLMRDGHLPMQVHNTRKAHDLHQPSDADSAHAIEITRFTSVAASFVDEAAIARYIESNLGIAPQVMARQMMLPESVITSVLGGLDPAEGTAALRKYVERPQVRRHIVKSAKAMLHRMAKHVRAQANPAPGDTLMLVDLGYNGSVQTAVGQLLADELNVHVAGRYLVLRETEVSGMDKAGYFSLDHYDLRAVVAMVNNVALLEQLCTTATGSVIDYDSHGTPLRGASDIKQRQSDVREAAQTGCLHFAASHAAHALRQSMPDEAEQWRRGNASTFMRLMFLPLAYELKIMEAFEHDVNLGTDEKITLFDPALAERGLRQQGMFYQSGVRRLYIPAELAKQGMPTRLAHFLTSRFASNFRIPDFFANGIIVPTFYTDGAETVPANFNATPTHDGYHARCIPIRDCKLTNAIQFGALFDWIEVYSMTAVPADEHLNNSHDSAKREVEMFPILDGIEAVTSNLWHCKSKEGFALFKPPLRQNEGDMLLLVVFRPVSWRPGAQKPA